MKNLIGIIFLAASLHSCQSKQVDRERPSSISFEAERNAFFNHLKDPAEVALQLKATSIEFNANLMSDAKSFGLYANSPVKAAANLGLFLADLNYSIAYQQSAHTKDLFSAAYELSKVMGIEQSVLDFLMKRYSDNLAQNDSVKSVVDALFDKTTSGLRGTDRERLVGIAMAAYQIENLHLALGVIEGLSKGSLPDDARAQTLAPLFQLVMDQKYNLEITYGFLKSITDVADPDKNPNYPYYGNAFKELLNVYKKISIQEKIGSQQVIAMWNDEVIKELNDKVNVIRNKIVSVE